MAGPLSDRLKACYDQWIETRGRSSETWMAILDDRIEFRSIAMGDPHGAAFTGPRSERSEIKSYFDGLLAEWEMVDFRIDHYIEDGDMVAAVGWNAWRNKATGKLFESPKVDIWRFEGDKVVAFSEFYDTAKIFAAATA
jgi:hypothetical protein